MKLPQISAWKLAYLSLIFAVIGLFAVTWNPAINGSKSGRHVCYAAYDIVLNGESHIKGGPWPDWQEINNQCLQAGWIWFSAGIAVWVLAGAASVAAVTLLVRRLVKR